MGRGAKGTEAGENLACSQTTWWSGVGGDDGCSAKGHGAARQDPGTQHPGKPWAAGLQEVHLAQSAQREGGRKDLKKANGSWQGQPSMVMQQGAEGQELLLGLAKDRKVWGTLSGTAAHRPLPPPPPPPWPPASGAPDIMRNSTTGMMYIQYLAKNDFCS